MRRTHHDIEAAILKSCAFNSLSISQLLASQNLSYKVLKPTLNHLVSCKLVEYEIDGKRKLVSTTELGLTALEAYENALALLEGRQAFLSLDAHPRLTKRQTAKVMEHCHRTKGQNNSSEAYYHRRISPRGHAYS